MQHSAVSPSAPPGEPSGSPRRQRSLQAAWFGPILALALVLPATQPLTVEAMRSAPLADGPHRASLVLPSPAVLTSLAPNNAVAGGPAFTLTVTGTGLTTASTVRWNGADRPTFAGVGKGGVVPSVSAEISAADIAVAGTASVTVATSIPDLAGQIAAAQALVQQLQSQMAAQQLLIAQTQSQIDALNAQIASIQAQITQANQALAAAQAQLAQTQTSLSNAMALRASLQTQIAATQSQIETTQAQLQAALAAVAGQVAALEAEIANLLDAIAAYEAEGAARVANYLATQELLTAEQAHLAQIEAQHESRSTDYAVQIQVLNDRIAQLNAEYDQAYQAYNSAEDEATRELYASQFAAIQAELDATNTELSDLLAEQAAYESDYANAGQATNDNIAAYQAQMEFDAARADEIGAQDAAARARLEQAQQELATLQNSAPGVPELNTQLAALQTQLQSLQSQLAGVDNQIATLTAGISTAQAAYDAAVAQLTTQQQTLGQLNANLTAAQQTLDAAQTQLAALQAQLAAAQAALQELQDFTPVVSNALTFTITAPVLDTTPPMITPSVTGMLGNNGWYTSNVDITWAVTDPESVVSSSANCGDGGVMTDTAGVTFTCTATSQGGTSSQSVTMKRDATPPTVTVAPNLNATAPTVAGVSVLYPAGTATDAMSGVPVLAACSPASGSAFAEGTTTVTCTATDNAGNTGSASFTVTVTVVPVDGTPPVITPTVTGTLGQNGWYTSNVTISWSVSDAESAVSTTGCGGSSVTADTAGTTFTCTATSEGGTSSQSVTIKRDATAPTVTPPASQTATAPTAAGVAVTYPAAAAADVTSGVAGSVACSPASGSTFAEGTTTVSCTANDNAGNTGSATFTVTVTVVLVDSAPPVITYTGNLGSYTPDQTVSITCTASDSGSGVAATTCQNINAPAYTFQAGVNTFSATATDNAGNTGGASVSFTVLVTADSLSNVIKAILADTETAGGLIASVEAIASAPNGNAKAEKLKAFENKVDAQTGKKLTAAQAAMLKRLAKAL